MADRTTFEPDWVSAPGETVEDLLEDKGWTKKEFASRVGLTQKHVGDLAKGRVPITADVAERLSRTLGSSPEFWLTRDAQYQAALQARRAIEEAEADAGWLKELPVSWMKKRGWIGGVKGKGELVRECLRFFGVHSVEAWRKQYESPLVAFRASDKFERKVGSVAAWLRRAELEATDMYCEPYDSKAFKEVLVDLRALTCEPDPAVFIAALQRECAACGVAVVFVPEPKGCPANGATQWLSRDKAMLVLSLRYKSNDHLWFSFFHEAKHILDHSKKMLFIEGMDGLSEELEEEANRFAADLLIPPEKAEELYLLSKKRYLSKEDVRGFASEIGVAPGIVVGRMQNEGWLPWTHMNGLKVRYEWDDN